MTTPTTKENTSMTINEPGTGHDAEAGRALDLDAIRASHVADPDDGECRGCYENCSHCEGVKPWPCETLDLLDALDAAEGEVARLLGLLDRNGIRYCLCSPADRMHDRARPECPHHGTPQHHHVNAARAERDSERARADGLVAAVKALAGGTSEIGRPFIPSDSRMTTPVVHLVHLRALVDGADTEVADRG